MRALCLSGIPDNYAGCESAAIYILPKIHHPHWSVLWYNLTQKIGNKLWRGLLLSIASQMAR